MRKKARKMVYTLGYAIMAIVVFLLSLVFTEKRAESIYKEYESTSSRPSSSQIQDSHHSGAGLGGGGGDSGGGGGGGESSDVSGESGGGGGVKPWFAITTSYDGRLYLRQDSKGDYVGYGEHGFVGDKKYYLENATDENPLYYFGLSMDNTPGTESKMAQIELITLTNDILPYASLDKTGNANDKLYFVEYFPYYNPTLYPTDVEPFVEKGADYQAQELRYRTFVRDNYLSVPDELKQTLLDLAEENELVATSSTIIQDVATYIQNAAYYDYYYTTRNYPSEKDMVTYFLTEHKRGVCRHFAAAATMMFRSLGIPARYTTGFVVDVEADVRLEYIGDGHAWTEVYVDGYGWIAVEVTGGNIYVEGEE